MKILLTGANGNFGKEFIKQSQDEIISLNREDWQNLDDHLRGVDIVIHAASDLRSKIFENPTDLINSNVVTTTKLLEAIKTHKINKFIFISSCAVYGESMRTPENGPCQATSINGIGKLLNEKIISEFCEKNKIDYNILRVFNMYGGNDNFSILSHIRRSLENNKPFILNNGGIAQRDFVHVSDVVKIIQIILTQQIPHTRLNIGTGISTKISTLVEIVKKQFPELKIEFSEVDEAEYSRADIRRLRSIKSLTDYKFISIKDFLRESFLKESNL